ncbi:MAG: ribonuclease III domain-containing protein [Verrucomicrobiota bacterium]
METPELRQQAWIGDAVLSLFARRWILAEKGAMDGELHTRMTSNRFLATFGKPTEIEARIGTIFEDEGLDAACAYIQTEILPRFLAQERKERGRR